MQPWTTPGTLTITSVDKTQCFYPPIKNWFHESCKWSSFILNIVRDIFKFCTFFRQYFYSWSEPLMDNLSALKTQIQWLLLCVFPPKQCCNPCPELMVTAISNSFCILCCVALKQSTALRPWSLPFLLVFPVGDWVRPQFVSVHTQLLLFWMANSKTLHAALWSKILWSLHSAQT